MEEASNTSKGDPVLPEHLIVEIFSRLPVKILMRFKCVCKSWYTIISSPSPYFVSKHLQHYYQNPKNDDGCLLIHPDSRPVLFPDPTLTDFSFQHLDTPVPVSVILGPCNGIFFLRFEYSRVQVLWNPATKECKVLPRSPPVHSDHPSCGELCHACFGFGYDPESDGFKVVIVRQDSEQYPTCSKHSRSFLSQGLVYSSCSDSWIQFDLPWRLWVYESRCYSYLKGVYYWFAQEIDNYSNEFVVSFDMGSNSFNQVVSSPNSSEEHTSAGLLIYRDAIAWVKYETSDYFFHMWVLNQDENGCSWTKQFGIGPFPEIPCPLGCWKNDQLILHSAKEILYWKNDEEELEIIQKLLLYNPNSATLETRNLGITFGHCYRVLNYKESFVSINGEKYNPGDIPSDWTKYLNPCPSLREHYNEEDEEN